MNTKAPEREIVRAATEAIARHVYPMDVKGDASRYGDMWRTLVAQTPQGPLVLMEFKLSIHPSAEVKQ